MASESRQDYRSIWTDMQQTSFRQGWVNAGGINTRFVQAGSTDAPALVMLHGTAGSWEAFSGNLGPHSAHFNCLAIDMIGSGFSDKPDIDYEIPVYVEHIRNFMNAMGVKKASFIGVSLGAWVAARFAHTHPDMTRKITLLSAAGVFANEQNMARIRTGRGKAVEDPSWVNIKPIFDKLLYLEKNRIDDLIAVRQAVYRQPGMQQAMAHVLSLQDPVIRRRNLLSEAEWKSIRAPALLIGAVDDPDEYLETARIVSKWLPDARYVEMHEVGHWPQFENVAGFNKLNIDFLLEK